MGKLVLGGQDSQGGTIAEIWKTTVVGSDSFVLENATTVLSVFRRSHQFKAETTS